MQFYIFFLYLGPLICIERGWIETGEYDTERIWTICLNYLISTFFYTYGLFSIINQKKFLIDQIRKSQEQHQQLNLILDNLEESIMIIGKDKLDFVNDKFLEMF